MPWRGDIAFEDEALAFRGESAENRLHAQKAIMEYCLLGRVE